MKNKNEKLNFTAKIAKYFLANRAVSIVILIIIPIAGIASFIASPKAKDPEMNIPQFQISFDLPGATADEVEEFVTKEVEELLADLEGVEEINSVSIDGGRATVTVEFGTFVNLEDAKINVLSKLNEKEGVIRNAGLSSPVIKNLDSNALAILEFGFTSDVLNQNQIRLLVVDILSELRKVPGVSNLEVRGGERRSLRIVLDPGKMQMLDVSATDVINSINASNIKSTSGIVRTGDRFIEIEVNGTLWEKDTAERILIKPEIQVRDIAKVEDYFPEKTSSSQIWKKDEVKDGVYIAVAKVKGQDSIKVANNTVEALEREIKKEKYKDISYEVFRDNGKKSSAAIVSLVSNLVISIAVVLIVLIYFLNFRAASNVAVALPLSIMIAFILGYLNGEVLSEVALYGLILALGLLVDSATVIVEGAYGYIQQGMDKANSFVRALNESGIGLLISNLTTIIVFVPVASLSGTVGQYIYPAVFYIIASLVGSLLLAYSMIPFVGMMLLKKEETKKEKKKDFIDKLGDVYVRTLEKILKSRTKQKFFAMGVLIAFIIAFLFPFLGLIKEKSIAGGDTDLFSVYVDGPEGMDVIRTHQITNDISNVIRDRQYIESIQVFTAEPQVADTTSAGRGSDGRNTPNVATIVPHLDQELAADDFEKYVNETREALFRDEKIKKIMEEENVKIKVLANSPIPVRANVELKIKGPQKEIREQVARDMEDLVGNITGAIHIDSSIEDSFPKFVYRIDHDKALASGVTAANVSDALQAALGPLDVSQYHIAEINEPATIELQFARGDRNEIADLSKIFVTSTDGDTVPLDSVVERIETRNEPQRILDARNPTTRVTAEVQGVPSVDVTSQIGEVIENEYKFPNDGKMLSVEKEGFYFELPNAEIYAIEWGGELKESNDSNADLQVAMLIAFAAIVFIFIAQFNSIKLPLIVISAIPLGLIGVLPGFAIGFLLIDLYYTSMSTIGFIALMGIVVNNSILLIEFYELARKQGMNNVDAFLESGRKRFRPIMLTTATTILGNFIMVFDPTWNSLAWTIIFGLSVSTGLVIFMVPILYSLFVNKEEQETETNKVTT